MIHTLGYQQIASGGVAALVAIAREQGAVVVDCRMSRKSPGWHETTLSQALGAAGQGYHIAPGLGNRNYRNGGPIELDNPEPELVILQKMLAKGGSVILLCACRNFAECHRTIIAGELARRTGVAINHIQPATVARKKEPGLWTS